MWVNLNTTSWNLLPDTQCKSWNGQKYRKCPNSKDCFLESTFNEERDCSNDINPPSSECQTADFHAGWKCQDGQCIQKELLCNNKADCDDKSDETLGCDLFPESQCKSWFGLRHVKCAEKGRKIISILAYKRYFDCAFTYVL